MSLIDSREPSGYDRSTSFRAAAAGSYVLYALTSTQTFKTWSLQQGQVVEWARSPAQALALAVVCAIVVAQKRATLAELGLTRFKAAPAAAFAAGAALVAFMCLLAGYFAASLVGVQRTMVQNSADLLAMVDAVRARSAPSALAALAALGYAIANPFAEELLFHGLIVGSWRGRMSSTAIVGSSAVVFSATHVWIYGYGTESLFFFSVFGGCLAAIYVATMSVWYTLLAHLGANVGLLLASWIVVRSSG